MNSSNNDDRILVRLSVEGDIHSFNRLTLKYQGVVRGLLRSLCSDKHSADDLAQVTFLKAWRKIHTFGKGNFKSWLCAIAYREFLQQQRQQRAVPVHINQVSEEFAEPGVSDQIDLEKAIAHLTPVQRNVLTLSYIGGFTQIEISKLLNLPIGTVKSHALRGVARLKKLIGENHEN